MTGQAQAAAAVVPAQQVGPDRVGVVTARTLDVGNGPAVLTYAGIELHVFFFANATAAQPPDNLAINDIPLWCMEIGNWALARLKRI
jgi:hypothetical protein